MKFSLSMDEVAQLVQAHIEAQYGRVASKVVFRVEPRVEGKEPEFTATVEDRGPTAKSTPAPKLDAQ